MNPRTGKIARLPAAIRTLVNHQLRHGTPYRQIIQSLASQGYPGVVPSNLTHWRQGGYLDSLPLLAEHPPRSDPGSADPAQAGSAGTGFEAWLWQVQQTMHPDDWTYVLGEHPRVFYQLLRAYTRFSNVLTHRRKQLQKKTASQASPSLSTGHHPETQNTQKL